MIDALDAKCAEEWESTSSSSSSSDKEDDDEISDESDHVKLVDRTENDDHALRKSIKSRSPSLARHLFWSTIGTFLIVPLLLHRFVAGRWPLHTKSVSSFGWVIASNWITVFLLLSSLFASSCFPKEFFLQGVLFRRGSMDDVASCAASMDHVWPLILRVLASIDGVNIFIHLSIHLSIYISIYLSIDVSMYLCIYLSIYIYIYHSIYISINQSIYHSIYILLYLSITLSIYVYL